ncbi:MAG: hypothetical protein AAB845_03205, partial [Patescibacteria group bacterium]
LRVIDKPVTKLVVSNKVGYGLTILATAVVLTSIFFGLLSFITNKRKRSTGVTNIDSHIGEAVPWIDPQKFVAIRPEKLGFQELSSQEISPVEEVLVPKPVVAARTAQKVAHAPGNLPIMAGALPQFGIEEVDLMTEESLPEIAVEEAFTESETPGFDVTTEPTVEEYKRRLNELLKGKPLT